MTQQPIEQQQTLDIIRSQHKDLLLQLEKSEVDLEQVRIFLKALAQAGAIIDDAEDRSLLHELIRYWSSFINSKTGEFPVILLQPFDMSHSTGKLRSTFSSQRVAALETVLNEKDRRRSDRRSRQYLLKRCRTIWIDGLLEPSMHQTALIDLRLQEQPDALENPWQLQVQEVNRAPYPLPVDTSIVQIYDEAEGELLILGEPGSGKTTLLLQLARVLLDRAEHDERLPMPVIFHLSSWAEKRLPLSTWMVEELSIKYVVPRKIAQDWINSYQVHPLLDGLDEVSTEARTSCVQAITAYCYSTKKQVATLLVVCCRSQEYQALPVRLPLQRAVNILPLTHEQIEAYLSQGQFNRLRLVLNEDAELYSLACQPLMLNIFTLAYQKVTSEDIHVAQTREQIVQAIFSRYVDSMFYRRSKLKAYSGERARHWLMFLARQMRRHHQTVFSVENIQPNWLSDSQRALYRWSVGLAIGLVIGLIFGVATELLLGRVIGQSIGLFTSLVVGLLSGLIVGLIFGLAPRIKPVTSLSWPMKQARPELRNRSSVHLHHFPNEDIWRSAKNGLIVGLITWMLVGLGIGIFTGLGIGIFTGLGIGLLVGLFAGLGAFVLHFALRFWLWCINSLPWNLILFLDEAAERLLLRKVGGSYIFVHRLLLDYFVSLETNQIPIGGIEQAQISSSSQ